MLAYLLKSSDLASLVGFVSGDFFKVVPVGDLASLGAQLRRNAGDADGFAAARADLDARLEAGGLSVRLARSSGGASRAGASRETTAGAALDLFFFQVLAGETWLLDFRAASFSAADANSASWAPKALWWSPSDEFRRGVRELYTGFYGGDDARFVRALAALGLSAAEAPLRAHFGLGDQRAVRFELATFQATFASVFRACRVAGTSIPPEFAVLGLMLLTLYEHLEALGGTFDVRASFERAHVAAGRSASRGREALS